MYNSSQPSSDTMASGGKETTFLQSWLCFNSPFHFGKCFEDAVSKVIFPILLLLDIKVKELDKRASGQAFEVILGDSAPESKGDFPLSPQKKKDWSLEEIQKKLEAAEERRKVRQAPAL